MNMYHEAFVEPKKHRENDLECSCWSCCQAEDSAVEEDVLGRDSRDFES